jgi:hypothetical protein
MASRSHIKLLIGNYDFTELYKLIEKGIYYDDIRVMEKAFIDAGELYLHKILSKQSNIAELLCYYATCMIWYRQGLFYMYLNYIYRLSIDFPIKMTNIIKEYIPDNYFIGSIPITLDNFTAKMIVKIIIENGIDIFDEYQTEGELVDIWQKYARENGYIDGDKKLVINIDNHLLDIISRICKLYLDNSFAYYFGGVCDILFRYKFEKLAICILKEMYIQNLYAAELYFRTACYWTLPVRYCLNNKLLVYDAQREYNPLIIEFDKKRIEQIEMVAATKIFIDDIVYIIAEYIPY